MKMNTTFAEHNDNLKKGQCTTMMDFFVKNCIIRINLLPS